MRFLLAALLLVASCIGAAAQGCGSTNPNCIVPTAPAGTSDNRAASTAFVQSSASGSAVKGPATSVVGDVPQWNNTAGTLLSDPTAITANAQDFYFGTGRPWCDVRAQGARGNQVHDDTAAFQACVTQLASIGGIIYVPPGNYCIKTGPINITGAVPISVVISSRGTEVQTCSVDGQLFNLNNAAHEIVGGVLVGSPTINTVNDAITLASNCTECRLVHVTAGGGRYVVNNSATDVKIDNISLTEAYGAAVFYNTGSFSCNSCKIDQSYPVSLPAASTVFAAWAGTTPYTSGTVVSTNGYYIQAANSGTSGGSAPTLQPYGTYIQDNVTGTCPSPSGGVCWLLVGATTYAGVQLDTGSSTVTFTNRSDITGSYTYGLYLTGNTTQSTIFSNSFIGSAYLYNIYQSAGIGLIVTGSEIVNCITTNCINVYMHTTGGQDGILNNIIYGGSFGIAMDSAGKNYSLNGNNIYGAGVAGVFTGGTATNITIVGNIAGSSTAWGTNAIGFDISASANDYVTVIANQCHGATSCVVNSSTGTHNVIETTPGIFLTPFTFADSGVWGSTGITGTTINGSSVGATTPSTGAFTTLSATSTVNGAGITALFASPPAIGGTAPAAGAFTTLSATSTVSGAGITSLFASPPAIGGTSAAAGKFTSLNASGQITSTTGLPTIGSGACGSGSNGAVVSGSTNQSGQITIGASATTTCTISWSGTLATAPNACVFFPMNATAAATGTTVARVGAPSTGSVVLTGSALANANYAYLCL